MKNLMRIQKEQKKEFLHPKYKKYMTKRIKVKI
jgi:hypothetical protein